MMKCIYIDEFSILLLIIFKEENFNYRWISINSNENWYYTCNFKDWMSNEYIIKWLQKYFEFMIWKKMNNITWLLIYNDYENYIMNLFLFHYLKYDIQVILFLSHISHFLQSFDINVFNFLKYYLSWNFDKFIYIKITKIEKYK